MVKSTGKLLVAAALVAAAFMAASCGRGSGKVFLRLNLEKGQVYKQRVVTEQKIAQTVSGRQQLIDQSIGMGMSFDIEDVDDAGACTMKCTYTWVLIKQKGPMGTIEYDSDNPPARAHPMAMGFAGLLGQGFSFRMTSTGEILEVKGIEEMISNMMSKVNFPNEQAKAQAVQAMKRQFGDESIKGMLESSMATFPSGPVAVGDSWSKVSSVSVGMPMVIDNTWTLKELKGGVAVVEVKSSIKPNPDAEPMSAGRVNLKYELSGEQSGTMEIDARTGWLGKAKMDQKFSGEIQVIGAGTAGVVEKWPMNVESVIEVRSMK